MESSQIQKGVSCVLHLLFFSYYLVQVIGLEEDYLKYKDPEQPLNVRINDLLGRMTLAEKLGQMSQIERSIAKPHVLKNFFIGLYINLSRIELFVYANIYLNI